MGSKAIETDIEELQPDAIGRWLQITRDMQAWAAELEAFAHRQLEAGVEIPGWKLVAKRAQRSWADEAAAMKYLKAHLPIAQYAPRAVISPAAAEKLVDLPDDLIVSKSSGTTVAPEEDKRPAVLPGLAKAAQIMQHAR